MQIDSYRVTLPLKKKFAVSKGSAEVKTNVLTILNNRYAGEAAGSVYYGPSVEQMEADLAKGIEYLKTAEPVTVRTLEAINEYDIHPAARAALTGMVLNYLSGESQRYPWEILSLGTPVGIKSSFTVGIDDPAQMIASIKASNHPIIKIKLGTQEDVRIIEGLKDVIGKDIRVDANGGWKPEQAEEMIFRLSKQGVRIIEQPTDPEYIEEWKHLKGRGTGAELIIDEGLRTLEDYERFADHIDGVNIKMEKSGGILEAIRIARKARKDKKKVMLGCMVESSVGIAQSVYMSSLADYCDLDGPQLIEQGIASGITYQRERIEVDREIIGGPRLKRDVVEKYIQG